MCSRRTSETFQPLLEVARQDVVHYVPGGPVGNPEEDAGDDDEADHDPGGLHHLLAIRPLYSLELPPASLQEVDQAVARGRPLGTCGSGSSRRRYLGALRRGAGIVTIFSVVLLLIGSGLE